MQNIEILAGRQWEYKFVDGAGAPRGTFEGYGSVFNNEDENGDLIQPGAFTKTLADHNNAGTMPKMLLNHGGMASFFAAPAPEDLLPVGKWKSMSEDTRGLNGRGQLINLDTESGKRLYGAMKEGQVDGLSMTYVAKQFTRGTKANEPRRRISQAHLIEVGPVTFPSQGLARINSLSSAAPIATTLSEFETFLRERAGFSWSEAHTIAERGFKAIGLAEDEQIRRVIAEGFAPLARSFRVH